MLIKTIISRSIGHFTRLYQSPHFNTHLSNLPETFTVILSMEKAVMCLKRMTSVN